jgi:acetyltransferase-like isoleucine patch superfamily enzyme
MEIKIAIATNINFYKHSLPIVLESLVNCGIEKTQIFVFNAGFSEEKTEKIDDITHYYLTHNSYEYSPLIEIVEKELVSDYWFLIHDTCKVGLNGKTIVGNDNLIMNYVNIGHDVNIGNNNEICASSVVAGWVKIGDNNKIKLSVTIRNRVTIGNNNIIGMGSNVVANITNNKILYGNPCKIIKDNIL